MVSFGALPILLTSTPNNRSDPEAAEAVQVWHVGIKRPQ